MLDTLDRLEELTAAEPQPAFSREMEPMIVSACFDFPHFVQVGLLRPEFFEVGTARLVIATILNYHADHGTVPTRDAIRDVLSQKLTVDDPFEEVFRLLDRKSNPREVPHVKDRFQAWLRTRAYGRLFDPETIAAYHNGDYGHLRNLIAQADLLSSPLEGEPFDFLDASDFMAETIHLEWLVEGLLVANQPCIIGGKDKCLKTATVCDLALSLATGTPFLDHFPVPQARRVAFFSAESGKLDIQRRFKAILATKGLALPTDMLKISFSRPQLSNLDDLVKLGQMIERYKAEVVIVDPLYLTLLAGDDSNTSASDLYGMGNKFGMLSDVINKAGATAVLVHHYKKTTEEGTLGLNEFTFTGASAFARQSLHIGRRRPYSGPQTNQMRFMNHGFANGTTYALDIDEDAWLIKVEPEAEAITKGVQRKVSAEVGRLADYLTQRGPSSLNRARADLGWNPEKFRRLVNLSCGRVEEFEEAGKRLYRTAP